MPIEAIPASSRAHCGLRRHNDCRASSVTGARRTCAFHSRAASFIPSSAWHAAIVSIAGRHWGRTFEDIDQFKVVVVRPHAAAAAGVDQFRRDAHPLPGPAHASLHQVAHAQLFTDLLRVGLSRLERVAGAPAGDKEPPKACERRDLEAATRPFWGPAPSKRKPCNSGGHAMNHATSSSHPYPRTNARVTAWPQRVAGWLMRAWESACHRAESKERVVPYY
jgi:hypothetical protein